jgi:hypothetical protein
VPYNASSFDPSRISYDAIKMRVSHYKYKNMRQSNIYFTSRHLALKTFICRKKFNFKRILIKFFSASYPCFENPYSFDIHESPVTLVKYVSDCPVDLIAALTLVGRNQRRQGVKLSGKVCCVFD